MAKPSAGLSKLARILGNEPKDSPIWSDALALVIQEYARGAESADEACHVLFAVLTPIIQKIAYSVARLAPANDRDDFVDDAPSLILGPRKNSTPRICLYDATKSTLTCWLRHVLRRCWASRQRKQRLNSQSLGDFDSVLAEPHFFCEQIDYSVALHTPFSLHDLERLCHWDIKRRIEILCLAGLWLKVPAKQWDQWLVCYETKRKLTLERPCPPRDFVLCDTYSDRLQPLAIYLCRPANTLSQCWKRAADDLNGLDFIREIKKN